MDNLLATIRVAGVARQPMLLPDLANGQIVLSGRTLLPLLSPSECLIHLSCAMNRAVLFQTHVALVED